MRSFVAAVIALSVCSLQAQALAFHVHAVSEQVRGGHRHLPAIHQHHDDERHDDDDRVRHVDGGDSSAGGTVITIAVPAGTTSAAVAVDTQFAEALMAPELQLIGDARNIDVRSHGPPPARNSFLRGPPTSILS